MKQETMAARSNRVLSMIIGIFLTSALGFTGVGWGATTSPSTGFPTTGSTSGTSGILSLLQITPPKNTFNIMMNYELGMHCTGFEFSYCCVLPPYNSILAQVVKTQQSPLNGTAFPRLLEADPNPSTHDFLGRPTVLRDTELDASGKFKKYVLRYWHDAQPRNDGRGAPQTSTLISHVEGNSLLMWNTRFDAAATDSNNRLVYGDYGETAAAVPGVHQAASPKHQVMLGNGSYADPEDNYANAWLNHLYIYGDLEGSNPTNTSLDKNKIRLGSRNLNAAVQFATVLPQNSGPAFHPMGPGSTPGLNNILTFSGDTGTVVFTQMKVLENLPVMLTSPRIWEALGLPLDPFEDSINFFGDPGNITEETVRPYVRMNAALHNYDPTQPGGIGTAVMQKGKPVVGFGTAPIDIPNCERCHALAGNVVSVNNPNSPSNFPTDTFRPAVAAKVIAEIDFWNGYYGILPGDSDWYSRLKGAAISILAIHDNQHRTDFTLHYPVTGGQPPQLTRLGHESVLCQRCHADNVIAVVKSATRGTAPNEALIPPLTEAIHNNHIETVFNDSKGRNGGCQGCHPAHRSDGNLANYPITRDGLNTFASTDNRDAAGGCFVGRDVHSNPGRGADLGGQIHLNVVGQWLRTNVANDTGHDKGLWCTNCHTQFSQEIWKAENVKDLVHSKPGDPGNVRGGATLANVAAAVGVSESQAIAWLDPKTNDDTFAVWNEAIDYPDGNVATIEILSGGTPAGTVDGDGDFSVRAMDFCTTPDCVAAAQAVLNAEGHGSTAVPVPMSAATDGRDHWLAPGEPHCADCHQAPYTEQSGNINAFPPFNYPRKASLFRYSRGHQDITCQGCHESTHGLYPVTPKIDTTTYAQAASMNTDGKHGPLKCGACHVTNKYGVPAEAINLKYNGVKIANNFDAAVGWAHSFTNEANPTQNQGMGTNAALCLNCHTDKSSKVSATSAGWLLHSTLGLVGRSNMDKAEIALLGHVSGDPASGDPLNGVCKSCHLLKLNFSNKVACNNNIWKQHVPFGAVSQSVWEYVSKQKTGSTCGF